MPSSLLAAQLLGDTYRTADDLAEKLFTIFKLGFGVDELNTSSVDTRYGRLESPNTYTAAQHFRGAVDISDAPLTGNALAITHAGVGATRDFGAVKIEATGGAGGLYIARDVEAGAVTDGLVKIVETRGGVFPAVDLTYGGTGNAVNIAAGSAAYALAANKGINLTAGDSIFAGSLTVGNGVVGSLYGNAQTATLAQRAIEADHAATSYTLDANNIAYAARSRLADLATLAEVASDLAVGNQATAAFAVRAFNADSADTAKTLVYPNNAKASEADRADRATLADRAQVASTLDSPNNATAQFANFAYDVVYNPSVKTVRVSLADLAFVAKDLEANNQATAQFANVAHLAQDLTSNNTAKAKFAGTADLAIGPANDSFLAPKATLATKALTAVAPFDSTFKAPNATLADYATTAGFYKEKVVVVSSNTFTLNYKDHAGANQTVTVLVSNNTVQLHYFGGAPVIDS